MTITLPPILFTTTTTTHHLTEPIILPLFGGKPGEVTAVRVRPDADTMFGYDVEVLARPKRASNHRWTICDTATDEQILLALGLIEPADVKVGIVP